MSTILERLRSISHRCKARELANLVIEAYFGGNKPDFPIDIFKMLQDFSVAYVFRAFDNLEGVYLPSSKDTVAVIGINRKRSYERQRFTAAHELAHHLRDFHQESLTPIDHHSIPIEDKEKYADNFAAELLMPSKYFLEYAGHYQNSDGYIEPDNALFLSAIFGTSFQSVMYKCSHHNLLNFELTKEFFSNFNVTKAIRRLNIKKLDSQFLRNIIDSYSFFPIPTNHFLWYRLQNELIYNDSRIEGLNISKGTVAEICADIRYFKKKSKYYQQYRNKREVIETIGLQLIYEKLMECKDSPDLYKLNEFHKLLYSLAPHGSLTAGKFRRTDNKIRGAKITTVHHSEIWERMFQLNIEIEETIEQIKNLTLSQTVEKAVQLHHIYTQIHPFEDGNGRISRVLLNWILKLKNLPPVYVESKDKSNYLQSLSSADTGNMDLLNTFFLKRILHSLIYSNYLV